MNTVAMHNAIRAALLGSAMAWAALATQPALANDNKCQKDCPAPAPTPTPTPTQTGSNTASSSEERPFDPLGGRIRAFAGQVDSLGGRIRAFEGDLSPFIGRIRAFEGDLDAMGGWIRAFEGDLDPFKGNIRAFWGDLSPTGGELDPKIGRIRAFSDDFMVQGSTVLAAWDSGGQAALEAALKQLFASGEEQWGDEVSAQTGASFQDGFAKEFFAKWGLDPANLSQLHNWDAWTRQAFLLDWYDNLLNFSGMDHVDHWMNAVNWTPALTQVQGGGASTTIGVLDFFATPDSDVGRKTVYAGGYQNINDSHGTAVSSLLVSSHDGRGIMGIAPNATIAGFNPFDETLTASWDDVRTGLVAMGQANASVVNLSLGVSGYTMPSDWRDLFNYEPIQQYRDSTIYVIAAGNDGIAQPHDLEFGGALDTTFILVGSVDPNGQISAFSNRPGIACLLNNGSCGKTNGQYLKGDNYLEVGGPLMYRFLVAPGEMILVSDGLGGVTRVSGTSFAAPLVTGAIALIQDRWPWLKDHPDDVAKAILESAQDLGEPGVDPVYGWGLLDIEASQAALDFNDLTFYLAGTDGSYTPQKINQLQKSGFQSSWAANDMYFVAFEDLVDSDRDFLIPLSGRLFNTSVNGQTMQEFMYHRFVNWLGGTNGFAKVGISDMQRSRAVPVGDGWSFAMSGTMNVVSGNRFLLQPVLETTARFSSPDNGFDFAFGHGNGAALIGGQRNLGLRSDYNPATGGANPLLGFAAGGTHVSTRARIAHGLDFSLGFSEGDASVAEDIAREDFGLEDRNLLVNRGDYRAFATTARLDYAVSGASQISLAVTILDERDALLGVRSIEESDFGSGVRTTGLTMAADFDLGDGVSLFGSATGSTSAGAADATLRVNGALSSAFQLGVAKRGVLGTRDNLRLTVAQPLTLERGYINAEMIGVVDRTTGEKGTITERFDIANTAQRRFVAEGYYAAPVLRGAGEVSMFARAELRPDANVGNRNSDFLGGIKFIALF